MGHKWSKTSRLTISDPFGTLWNVDKPAMLGLFLFVLLVFFLGTPFTQNLFSPGNGGIGGISGDGGLPDGGGPLDGIGAEAGGAAAAVAGLALALSALLCIIMMTYICEYYHLNLAIHSSRANPGPC